MHAEQVAILGDAVSGGIIKRNRAVVCEGARIVSIVAADSFSERDFNGEIIRAPHDHLVTASFIDLQVNGAGGACFQVDRNAESLHTMTRCLELSGVGYFAPTVTSSDQEIYRELRNIFREYSQHESATTAINFEGPFINKSKGGMHAAQYIHDMDRAYQDIYYDLIEDTRVIMTVAPEASRADIIAKMVADCVIISAGHTSVGAFEAEAFFDLGVSNVTHIFNGMTPVTGREPGITGLALSRPDIYCSMIVDGHHLHPEAVNLVWRLKGSDRIYLISDGMPHLGSEIEKYQYGDVEIENVDGALKDAAGTLSGTKVPINEMARNVVDITGARIEKVVNTITSVPASVIRRSTEIGDIQVGMAASINIIDRSFNVKYMMKDGAFRVRPDV